MAAKENPSHPQDDTQGTSGGHQPSAKGRHQDGPRTDDRAAKARWHRQDEIAACRLPWLAKDWAIQLTPNRQSLRVGERWNQLGWLPGDR